MIDTKPIWIHITYGVCTVSSLNDVSLLSLLSRPSTTPLFNSPLRFFRSELLCTFLFFWGFALGFVCDLVDCRLYIQ